ncbi:MAG: flagellar biosynthesis protein FlhF [SAR324 cluster bacterium]|nr:flagellar biosynthesis protein FlhF [SAR324 cluster bacterium]
METRKFVAPTIDDAIQQIKNQYGDNALIISSRKIRKKTGSFGIFAKEMIEIVASPADDNQGVANLAQAGSLSDVDNLNEPASTISPTYNYQNKASISSLPEQQIDAKPHWQDQMFEVKDMINELSDRVSIDNSQNSELQHMRQEIVELKGIIKSIVHQKQPFYDKDWHENLISIYQQLTINGVEEKFTQRVIEEIQKKVSSANFEDHEYLKLFTARIFIQSTIVKNIFDDLPKNSKNIFSLVGVTGVGKSTTIAKLATMAKLKDKSLKVGLISLDNFRIGGENQLKEYAKIIKVPFRSVGSFRDLKSTLKSMRDCNLILIDTPGSSHRDAKLLDETQHALANLGNIKNILVLNATTKDQDISNITKRFAKFDIAGTIFTKLDEATTYGVMLNHMIRFKMPLLFLSAGQKVPDDLEIASHERLLELVLNMSDIIDS